MEAKMRAAKRARLKGALSVTHLPLGKDRIIAVPELVHETVARYKGRLL